LLPRRGLAQAEPAQDRTHRRDRHAQLAGNRGPTHPLPPQRRDLADPLRGDAVLATPRRRAAVAQLRRATASAAGQPAIALPLRYAGCFGRFRYPPTNSSTRRTSKSGPCGVKRAFL